MKTIVTLLFSLLIGSAAMAADYDLELFPRLEIKTTQGNIIVELDSRRAPLTVQNFVQYAQDEFYDGTIFHRVIAGFVAQAGGHDKDMNEKPTRGPIANESGNGLSNTRGTIAMARLDDPHSATAQFYFNLSDNSNLDPSPKRWGYCVFGKVTAGIETLDKIAAAGPKAMVMIESVRLLKEDPASDL